MGTIIELYNNLMTFDLDKAFDTAMLSNAEKLLTNYKGQLLEGKNQHNQPIGKYNQIPYAIKKEGMNSRPGFGNVDLKLTGAMFEGMKLIQEGDAYTVESNVEYFKDNLDRYGEAWRGWNDNTIAENSPLILATINKELRNALRL